MELKLILQDFLNTLDTLLIVLNGIEILPSRTAAERGVLLLIVLNGIEIGQDDRRQ